ncbi:MAG: AraC family transcriptional regulator [bacterium]|nr:AraC family transcriptional regulator [bacterium]
MSGAASGWQGIILEKGWSPHFYPTNVITPYFYFALALEQDLRWEAHHGGELQPLKTNPGDIWINPPDTPFTHKIDQPCFFTILAIEADIFLSAHPDALPPARRESLQFLNNYNVEDPLLKNFIELFYYEALSGGANGLRYIRNLLATLSEYFVNTYSNYRDRNPGSKAGSPEGAPPSGGANSRIKPEAIEAIESFILENLEEVITVDDLAAELNMSKFYFLREFKKAAGVTPHQYLTRIKMERASALLREGSSSLATVALSLGYGDQSHFSRVFKTHFGESPGNYRKRS